ncbi:MAG: deoxyribonuclease V [Syntrophales bacterium]
MKIENLHDWKVGFQEAFDIQEKLRDRIVLNDSRGSGKINLIAGADISYARGSNLFFAAVVLMKFPEMVMLETAVAEGRVDFPYIPGLLSFREGPILLKAFERLAIRPDVVLFDGQGIAHPRGIGLASHMGLFLNLPSIGCAKTKLSGSHADVGGKAGDFTWLTNGGRAVGAVLRTKSKVKPIFVSPGHKISLERAVSVAFASCAGYRLPEPTRRAHLEVNRIRMENERSGR